jgi:GTPase
MILITDDNKLKVSVKKFIAQIHVLHSPTTIKEGYQPFIHVDHVRQSVKITQIRKIDNINENNEIIYSKDSDTILRTGDKATVQLEFIIRPEYIKSGMRIIFREGKVRAVGKVVELL